MLKRALNFSILSFVTIFAACTSDDGTNEHYDISNQGVACLHTGDIPEYNVASLALATEGKAASLLSQQQRIIAGQDLVVSTLFFLPTGSAFNKKSSCDVKLEGQVITVTSKASYETTEATSGDIGEMIADCNIPLLSPGVWTLNYGGRSKEFTLPDVGENNSVMVPCTFRDAK